MQPSTTTGIRTDNEWDQKWTRIFDHYQQDLRHAYYINALHDSLGKKILEIGAGSFRDCAALNRMGFDCSGMDYSKEAVALAQQYYPELKNKFYQMDAFHLEFENGTFDMSYHNGFWVLFSSENILRLAKEQARVTRSCIIATVHNGHNQKFQDYFEHLAQTDPLYKIRFFQMNEMIDILMTVCKKVRIVPVGKGKKTHEDAWINQGRTEPRLLKRYFRLCGHRLLESSERLLCIGEL